VIPAAQVKSDWNSVSGFSEILNKPSLFSGSYHTLVDTPNISVTDIANWNTSFGWGNWATQGFLTTEVDPTVPSYSKTLTAFSVIKTSTDPLYRPITYVPAFVDILSKPNTVAGYNITDAVTNSSLATTLSSYATNSSVTSGLATKQDVLISGINIKTIETQSVLGSGNIDLNKSDVGLSNVDNTTDLNKPISTATQTALNGKFNNPVGTSGQYINGTGTLTTFPTIPTNTNQLTNGAAFVDQSGARTSISLTTTGTSGISTYSSATGVLNIPNYLVPVAPSFNATPGRTLSTTGTNNTFTISSSRPARVTYTINFSVALLLAVSNGQVDLDYSTDGGSTWIPVSGISQVFGVSITITTSGNQILSGDIPANALVRINRVTNTNCTVTISKQQEVQY
jgi:hypothetical protein